MPCPFAEAMAEPEIETKSTVRRDVTIAVGVVFAGFLAGLIVQAIRRPCPCRDNLGEADASANAIGMASAVLAEFPPLPDFGTERIVPQPPKPPKPRRPTPGDLP